MPQDVGSGEPGILPVTQFILKTDPDDTPSGAMQHLRFKDP